jgi:hypothetical protein
MSLPSEPSSNYFPPPRPGTVIKVNGGGDFFIVGSRFSVSGGHADLIMDMLPPIVHIHHETEQAALRWSVEWMVKELHDPEPGGFLIAQHLAHMLLVQALRLHMAEGVMNDGGGLWAWRTSSWGRPLMPSMPTLRTAGRCSRWQSVPVCRARRLLRNSGKQ